MEIINIDKSIIDSIIKKEKDHDYEEFEDKYHQVDDYTSKDYFHYDSHHIPFVNSKLTDKLQNINTQSLTKLEKDIYTEIEEFPDYDYINSVAFEMLIRTNEYKRIVTNTLTYEEKKKEFDLLGINIDEIQRYNLKKMSCSYYQNTKKEDFTQSYCDLTINDIEDGLKKLIDFYQTKEQIYIVKQYPSDRQLNTEFEVDIHANYKKIYSSSKDYFIPSKFDFPHYDSKYKKTKIDNNILLVALEDIFLKSIKEDIPNNIKGKILFNFTRPLLQFKESSIIDVPINLNLSSESIMDYIVKIKNEFDNKSIKTPINYLYNENYISKDWKIDVPFKVTKKSISQAFYVYDLYQDINSAFLIKKESISKSKDLEIEKVKNNTKEKIKEIETATATLIKKLSTDIKKRTDVIKELKQKSKKNIIQLNKKNENTIKDIKKNYKYQYQNFNSEDVLINLVKEHNISAYMCKQYLKFMRKNIDNLNYKELIIGIKS